MRFLKSINGYQIPFATSEYEDGNEPAWSDGTGRDALDGTMVGTKIGDFAQLQVQIPMMPESISARFRLECEKEEITLEWWSTTRRKYFTTEFYGSATKSSVYMSLENDNILHPFVAKFTAIERK